MACGALHAYIKGFATTVRMDEEEEGGEAEKEGWEEESGGKKERRTKVIEPHAYWALAYCRGGLRKVCMYVRM